MIAQVLTSEYGEKVQRMRELRASRADRIRRGSRFRLAKCSGDVHAQYSLKPSFLLRRLQASER